MGEHILNPTAIAASQRPPGTQMVRYVAVGDDLGIIPGISLGWFLADEGKTFVAVAAVNVVKDSPIAGASTVVTVPLVNLASFPVEALKAKARELLAGPPAEPAPPPSPLLA